MAPCAWGAREFEGLETRDVPGITQARERMARWFDHVSLEEACATLGSLQLAPGCAECFARLREAGVTTAVASITWEPAVAHSAEPPPDESMITSCEVSGLR